MTLDSTGVNTRPNLASPLSYRVPCRPDRGGEARHAPIAVTGADVRRDARCATVRLKALHFALSDSQISLLR